MPNSQPARRAQTERKAAEKKPRAKVDADPLGALVATTPAELVRRYGRPELRRLMAHLRAALSAESATPVSGCPHPRAKRRVVGANAKNPGYAAVCEACGAIVP